MFDVDVIRAFFVENHSVLHTRATTCFNKDTKAFIGSITFFAEHLPDFICGALGDCNDGFRLGGCAHLETTKAQYPIRGGMSILTAELKQI